MSGYYSIKTSTLAGIADVLRRHGAAGGKNGIHVPDMATELKSLVRRDNVPTAVERADASMTQHVIQDAVYIPEAMVLDFTLYDKVSGKSANCIVFLKSYISSPKVAAGKAMIEKETLTELADIAREASGISASVSVSDLSAFMDSVLETVYRPVAYDKMTYPSTVRLPSTPTYDPNFMLFRATLAFNSLRTQVQIQLI